MPWLRLAWMRASSRSLQVWGLLVRQPQLLFQVLRYHLRLLPSVLPSVQQHAEMVVNHPEHSAPWWQQGRWQAVTQLQGKVGRGLQVLRV